MVGQPVKKEILMEQENVSFSHRKLRRKMNELERDSFVDIVCRNIDLLKEPQKEGYFYFYFPQTEEPDGITEIEVEEEKIQIPTSTKVIEQMEAEKYSPFLMDDKEENTLVYRMDKSMVFTFHPNNLYRQYKDSENINKIFEELFSPIKDTLNEEAASIRQEVFKKMYMEKLSHRERELEESVKRTQNVITDLERSLVDNYHTLDDDLKHLNFIKRNDSEEMREKCEEECRKLTKLVPRIIESFNLNGELYSFISPPIMIKLEEEYIDLGKIKVTVNMTTGDTRFEGYTYEPLAGHCHPHVYQDGKPCWGDSERSIPRLIASADLAAVTLSIIDYLRGYNPESPIKPLDGWRGVTLTPKKQTDVIDEDCFNDGSEDCRMCEDDECSRYAERFTVCMECSEPYYDCFSCTFTDCPRQEDLFKACFDYHGTDKCSECDRLDDCPNGG